MSELTVDEAFDKVGAQIERAVTQYENYIRNHGRTSIKHLTTQLMESDLDNETKLLMVVAVGILARWHVVHLTGHWIKLGLMEPQTDVRNRN